METHEGKLKSVPLFDLNEPAPESSDSPTERNEPSQLEKSKKPVKIRTEQGVAQQAIFDRERKRLNRKRYRQKLKLDPARRAILYPRRNKANRELLARRFEALTDQGKLAYREHVNSLHREATAKRKHIYGGFSNRHNQERHNLIQLEKSGTATAKDLERLKELRNKGRAKDDKKKLGQPVITSKAEAASASS